MILFDTGPLVALCDARDPYHTRAVGDLERLALESFATCDAVLAEVGFHLSHRAPRLRLRGLIERLGTTLLPESGDGTFHDQVFEWLLKYHEHQPDWADGCLAVLAASRHAAVWTYDSEFRTTWRLPNGGAIPLAL